LGIQEDSSCAACAQSAQTSPTTHHRSRDAGRARRTVGRLGGYKGISAPQASSLRFDNSNYVPNGSR